MTAEAAYLAVARFLKPHGRKGEALVYPLTDQPEDVFVPGRLLTPVDEGGHPLGDALVVSRARPYQRHWLVAFDGIGEREPLEGWPKQFLGVRSEELRPPGPDEIYVHEIPGCAVIEREEVIGTACGLVGVPGGQLLLVEQDGRELLIPFREPMILRIDREERRIEVDLPPGLLEL